MTYKDELPKHTEKIHHNIRRRFTMKYKDDLPPDICGNTSGSTSGAGTVALYIIICHFSFGPCMDCSLLTN